MLVDADDLADLEQSARHAPALSPCDSCDEYLFHCFSGGLGHGRIGRMVYSTASSKIASR
jgi:hypothetical protein